MKRFLTMVIVLLVALPIAARADEARFTDGDDAKGRLDIKAVAHGHADEGASLKHRVSTFRRWADNDLRGRSQMSVFFSTDDEDRFAEFRVVVDYKGGTLEACFQSYEEQSDTTVVGECNPIDVRRPNRRSVVVEFPPDMLGDGLTSYKWSASTYFQRPGTVCQRACTDWAPGRGVKMRGRVEHVL